MTGEGNQSQFRVKLYLGSFGGMIVWEIRNFTFQRKSNIFGGQTNFVVLSWVANHDCHICVIVAFRSSSMINGCFMVGEQVNILKNKVVKTQIWPIMHTKQDQGLFPTLCNCYRSDGLFGSEYYNKTIVLIRP